VPPTEPALLRLPRSGSQTGVGLRQRSASHGALLLASKADTTPSDSQPVDAAQAFARVAVSSLYQTLTRLYVQVSCKV